MAGINQEYLRLQIKQSELYVMYWHAHVVSGAYKLRNVTDLDGTPKSDEWKLQDALDIMRVHIQQMMTLGESLANLQKER